MPARHQVDLDASGLARDMKAARPGPVHTPEIGRFLVCEDLFDAAKLGLEGLGPKVIAILLRE